MSKRNLILIIAGLFAGIVFVELVLRTYYWLGGKQMFGLKPARSTLEHYDNDTFGSALVPNQKGWFVSNTKEYTTWVEINSQSWPDIEHTLSKPEGIYRIVILEDSFVENFQVPLKDRFFFRQLENSLNEKTEVNQKNFL